MKLTKENCTQVLSYKPDPKDERDYVFKSTVSEKFENVISRAPVAVSHRSKMTSVKNQGSLGSCVGFAVTSMKEWQETVEHERELLKGKKDHRKGKKYNLSESWVYWNSKKIDPWPNEEGTSIRFAMRVLQKLGVPCESAWPYNDKDPGEPEHWAPLISRWARIGSYWRVNNLNELKVALLGGPVVIGIPCFEEIFYANETGYIPYPANPDMIYGGHAVCVVGYNEKVFIFKNSWGKGWGNKGYGSLPYSYIDNFLWDAWTCKDVSMTKEMLKEERSLFNL